MNRKIYIISILAFFMLFFSCNKKQLREKPPHLVSQETVKNMLIDVYMIESMVNAAPLEVDKKEYANSLYNELLKKYNVDKEQLNSFVAYYLSNKEDADEVFQAVNDRLDAMKIEIDNEEHAEKLIDSIEIVL
ncbi:MAG: DUF4296 domain-containing protein [Bacteroidales bacterium]|jgi:hypothetical protein|nr:DUF4296 domain-containing protein [Bacteroidales bacterium]